MKFPCSECGAVIAIPDGQLVAVHEKIVVKTEPCKCGMTSDYRSWRVGALVIICVVILGLGSCVALELIELQKIKMIDQSKFTIEQQKNGFDKKSYRVVPKEEEKK